jgi:uncharacterized protein YwgA
MYVSIEDIVLATAYAVADARRRETGREYATLYDLNKVLWKVANKLEKRFGLKLPLRFIEYSYGPYSPDLEKILEKLAAGGAAEYVAMVHIPAAPAGGIP